MLFFSPQLSYYNFYSAHKRTFSSEPGVDTRKDKSFLPPSKIRKLNLGKKRLISVKGVLRIPEFTIDKSFTKYVKETKSLIFFPQRYNFLKIFYFLKRIQSYIRRYFLNLREKQFIRIHHAYFSKARSRLWNLPHAFTNFFDKAINQVLIRTKFYINLYELDTLLKNNMQFLLLNNKYIFKTKLFQLKHWDVLSFSLNINLNLIWRSSDVLLLLPIYSYTNLYLRNNSIVSLKSYSYKIWVYEVCVWLFTYKNVFH